MTSIRVLALCGSLQRESANLTLLTRAAALAPLGVEVTLFTGLGALPHFNPDLEGEALPSVDALRRALSESDAVLIACPEYGHSLPGALKNAIDWVIGTAELERKIVAVTASTTSRERGVRGLDALKVTLGAVSARVVYGAPIVRGDGADAEVSALLTAIVDEVRVGASS